MKNAVFVLFLLVIPSIVVAQAKIKFDSTMYKVGDILYRSGTFRYKIPFENTGNEPLIIMSAKTSDGGSMAEYPKEPIKPGGKDSIVFMYDTNRIGPFTKGVYVTSNTVATHTITFTGIVVYPQTTVSAPKVIEIGNLGYETTKKVQFEIRNTGKEALHLRFEQYYYPECDLIWLRIEKPDGNLFNEDYEAIDTGSYVNVSAMVHNVYGNTGRFEHIWTFNYNSRDTFLVSVRGKFVGEPFRDLVLRESKAYTYKGGKLVSCSNFDTRGNVRASSFFEGGSCVYRQVFDYQKFTLGEEFFYKNGRLLKRVSHAVPN